MSSNSLRNDDHGQNNGSDRADAIVNDGALNSNSDQSNSNGITQSNGETIGKMLDRMAKLECQITTINEQNSLLLEKEEDNRFRIAAMKDQMNSLNSKVSQLETKVQGNETMVAQIFIAKEEVEKDLQNRVTDSVNICNGNAEAIRNEIQELQTKLPNTSDENALSSTQQIREKEEKQEMENFVNVLRHNHLPFCLDVKDNGHEKYGIEYRNNSFGNYCTPDFIEENLSNLHRLIFDGDGARKYRGGIWIKRSNCKKFCVPGYFFDDVIESLRTTKCPENVIHEFSINFVHQQALSMSENTDQMLPRWWVKNQKDIYSDFDGPYLSSEIINQHNANYKFEIVIRANEERNRMKSFTLDKPYEDIRSPI